MKPIVIVNEAARFAVISVERTAPDANLFSVVFETVDGTAIAGEDYVQTSGTLTFAPRQRFKTFKVILLHDDISDGAETIRLLLKSADGSVTIGSAVVVLRESNLFASPRNVYPGGLLKVRGRFDVTQPLFVRITDYSGNNIRIRASRVSKRKAVVSVPCLINAETGELSAGKVVIQAEQGERVLGPSGFTTIAEAAETGEAAGAFTLEFIKVVRETLALAQSRWLAIEAQSLAAVDASELRGALLAMDTELQSLESDLQAMINGVVTSIPLCTIGTAEYVLDATSLAMLDRMLVASAFEGKFRPSSVGIASFRAAAETFSTAALPELDPIGDFHDEFNPTLKEKIAELFGFFSGWNEQAKTQTGRVFDYLEQSVGVPEERLAPLKRAVSAGIYYSTVLAPSIVGLSALSFADPFIELELGRPVTRADYEVSLDYLRKGSMDFINDNKDGMIALLEKSIGSGRIVNSAKLLATASDKAQKLLDLDDDHSVISMAFEKAAIIYANRPRPVVSVSDAIVKEPSSGARNAVFHVSLSRLFDEPVTVYFSTVPETAGASDFKARTGFVKIPKGRRSSYVIVPVFADKMKEGLETFKLNLTGATNATLGDSQGTCTIESLQIEPGPPTAVISSADPTITYQDNVQTDYSVLVRGSVTGGGVPYSYSAGWYLVGALGGTEVSGVIYPAKTKFFEFEFYAYTEAFVQKTATYRAWVEVYDAEGNVIVSDRKSMTFTQP